MSPSVIAGEAPRQGRDLASRIRTEIPGRVVKERGPTNGPNHRVGLEPTLPHYECGVLAAGRPVQTALRGPPRTGLEPPPDPARPEERAQAFGIERVFGLSSGAGGIRTPAGRVKSSLCCRYTTAPGQGVATFQSKCVMHGDTPVISSSVSRETWARERALARNVSAVAHASCGAGCQVLEPCSPGLQPGALPSKLPAQSDLLSVAIEPAGATKKPGVFCVTPGFEKLLEDPGGCHVRKQ